MADTLPAGPSEEGVYDIYQMCFAISRGRQVHDNFMLRDMHDGPMPLDYNVWIVRNAHRTVLVDTGFGPRAAAERGRPLDFDPVDGLRRIGVDPDALDDIVISHLHFDHAGTIERFGRARFHIQDDEVSHATGRCVCDPVMRFPFDIEDIATLIRRIYADRVVFHDGDDADFFPGLTLHAFPGHSARVMAVRVVTRRGPVLLASDATHYYANVLNGKPFTYTLDMAQTLDSYRRLMALAGRPDRLIPGHDPKVRRLFPAITVNGIELLALHEDPRPYDAADLARTDDY